MRGLVLLVLVAGCNQIFGLDTTVLIKPDAPFDAPGCAGSPFVNPIEVPGDKLGNTEYDPTASGDRELWVVRMTNQTYDIYIATRPDATSPFNAIAPFAHNSTTANDSDPALSGDGLVLMFSSQRTNGQGVYESRRPVVTDAFTAPQPVAVADGGGAGIDLSFDGLTLYYIDDSGALRGVHRAAREQPFGAPGPVLATDVTWPSLSPDELELYHQRPSGSGLYRRTRASTSVPFDANETVVSTSGENPDVSSDSKKLYFDNGPVLVMTRTCN